MSWYCAHAIMYIQFSDGSQDKYPIWENILLISADSDDEAISRAEVRAKEDEIKTQDFTWEERPAHMIFAGIRKLITCNTLEKTPEHGTELTYSEMEVSTELELQKLVDGQEVTIRYLE